MSGWLPIETAPKDGTKVFAFIPKYKDCKEEFVFLRWKFDNWHFADTMDSRGGMFRPICEPSHWMPLPDPPKVGESAYDAVHD